MNRNQKQDLVLQLKSQFQKNASIFFVNYQGLSVNELQQLRKNVYKANSTLKVAKVRLVKQAVHDLDASLRELDPFCKGQLGIVFSNKQDHEVAKVLYDFSKAHTNLSFVVGHSNGRILSKEMLLRLAQLPSREVLLAQIAGTMQNMVSQVARLIKALKEKRELM